MTSTKEQRDEAAQFLMGIFESAGMKNYTKEPYTGFEVDHLNFYANYHQGGPSAMFPNMRKLQGLLAQYGIQSEAIDVKKAGDSMVLKVNIMQPPIINKDLSLGRYAKILGGNLIGDDGLAADPEKAATSIAEAIKELKALATKLGVGPSVTAKLLVAGQER